MLNNPVRPAFVVRDYVERSMPSCVEAEQGVLGAILLDPSATAIAASVLNADDFYIEKHRWIYQAMLALWDRREAIDVLTLQSELQVLQHLESTGGPSYLTALLNSVPSAANVEQYARLVERASVERRIIDVSTAIAETAFDPSRDLSAKISHVRALVDEVENVSRRDAFEALRVSDLGDFEAAPEIVAGLVLSPSLNFFYGESGGGKTWLLLDLMYRVSRGEPWLGIETKQTPVLIIDTESGKRRIRNRIRSLEAGYCGSFGADSFVITDRAVNLNLGALGAQRDEAVRHRDLLKSIITQTRAGLVIVDAFADVAMGADENAAAGVMPVLNALREIANETDAAVVVIHHTNRNGTSRGGNYRGSSAIKGAVDSMLEIATVPSANGFVAKLETVKQRDGKPVQEFARAVFRDVLRDPSNFGSLMTAFSLEDADETDFDVDLRAILDALGNDNLQLSEVKERLEVEIADRTLTRKLSTLTKTGAIVRTGDVRRNMRYHRAAER